MVVDDLFDRMLLGRSAGGDVAAFEDLYRRYSRPVGAFLYQMSWDRELAESCLKEAFLRLWRSAKESRGETAVAVLAFRMARDVWQETSGKSSRRELKADPGAGGGAGSGAPLRDHAGEIEEMRRSAQRALESLDDAHRMVFALAHYEGMRAREIAAVLDLPVATVGSRMVSAERRLRERLADRLDPEAGT